MFLNTRDLSHIILYINITVGSITQSLYKKLRILKISVLDSWKSISVKKKP